MKFIKNTIRFITWFFLNQITSIVCITIILMLCFIIQEIGFVENINFKNTFFWVFFLPTYFLLFCLLSNTLIDRWSKAPETLKDKNDSESKAIKSKYEGNMNSIEDKEVKQFCYDSLNPCPYCDSKFEHTALHCAVYFNDIERLKEVIELIKKVDGVDNYKNSKLHKTLYGDIFHEKDTNRQSALILAILMKNTDVIKLLIKTTGASGLDIHSYNECIAINPDDQESMNRIIDLYQYKKKTQTGKDIWETVCQKALVKVYMNKIKGDYK